MNKQEANEQRVTIDGKLPMENLSTEDEGEYSPSETKLLEEAKRAFERVQIARLLAGS